MSGLMVVGLSASQLATMDPSEEDDLLVWVDEIDQGIHPEP
jgi:hypothetical protein